MVGGWMVSSSWSLSLTSSGCKEVDDEVVAAAGEQFVRLLGELVLVLIAERFHVVLHLCMYLVPFSRVKTVDTSFA